MRLIPYSIWVKIFRGGTKDKAMEDAIKKGCDFNYSGAVTTMVVADTP